MINWRAILAVALLFGLGSREVSAQDPTFSQVFASPTMLNPALTGLFAGRYRAVVSHRSQWGQVMPTPFSTTAFAADFRYRFDEKRRTSDAFGGGILFLNDRIASVSLASNQMVIGGAYHKNLDGRGIEQLSAGFQLGIAQRSLGYGELTFEDEFDGTSSYLSGAGGEVLPESSVSYGDYHFGLNYSRNPVRGLGIVAGLAMHHISQPEQSFYAEETAGEDVEVTNTLHARYSAYVSARWDLGSAVEILPRVYYLTQGPHAMAVVGSHFRFAAAQNDQTAFQVGALMRVAQSQSTYQATSVIGFAGLEAGDFLFGFSYDAGVFDSGRAGDRNRSTFELSASFIGLSDDDAAVPCPKF
ncbi:PorP/SprF family type IX secretion system membrane protein [Lewinella sp. IMCC34191]|uniref:PorP/SprF family type IX secretion system membrane protein n=1 Tax=Lewinella sp. IMCC34191 TaxID=2259172 RepID=UPI00130083B8|nr:PorP/SprF family type IX secretion system membrane protein [Lewinella sp. IMCC34191]